MIRVHEISKRYGRTLALDRLSFELGAGEILGLLGPNGAGKTSTLRILTGYLSPDGGRVEIDGSDLSRPDRELRRRTGYLPESNPLYEELNVRGALDFFGGLYGLGGAAQAVARDRVLERCGLAGREDQGVAELSHGYRQRLGLAQALLHDPEIIFLDEPTAGLDPVHIAELRELIRSFSGEKTVVLSTHVLSEVEVTCDRVLILDRGRRVKEASLSELEQGREICELEVRADFDPDRPPDWDASGLVARAREKSPGLWSLELAATQDSGAALAEWILGQGGRLHEMRRVRRGLEEVFLELIRGEVSP